MSNNTRRLLSSFHLHAGHLKERRRLYDQSVLRLIGWIRLETHFAFSSAAASVRGTSCTQWRSSLSGTASCFQ